MHTGIDMRDAINPRGTDGTFTDLRRTGKSQLSARLKSCACRFVC
jgi:hypothetical protein